MFLLTFLLITNTVFLHIDAQQLEEASYEISQVNIAHIAEEMLKALETVIDKALQIASTSIRFIKNQINEIRTTSVGVTDVLASYIESFILKKLDDIKLKYGATSKIIDCIESQAGELRQLPVFFMNETGVCVENNVVNALESLQEIVIKINQTESQIKTLTDDLFNCNHSSEANICILKIMSRIRIAIKSLPEKIKLEVRNAKDLILHLRSQLFECNSQNFKTVEQEALVTVGNIIVCITGEKL